MYVIQIISLILGDTPPCAKMLKNLVRIIGLIAI